MATSTMESRLSKLDEWKSDYEYALDRARKSLGGNFRLKNTSRSVLRRLRHSLTVSHVDGTLKSLGYVQGRGQAIHRVKGVTKEELDKADSLAALKKYQAILPRELHQAVTRPAVRVENWQPPKQFTAAQRRARRTNRRYGN